MTENKVERYLDNEALSSPFLAPPNPQTHCSPFLEVENLSAQIPLSLPFSVDMFPEEGLVSVVFLVKLQEQSLCHVFCIPPKTFLKSKINVWDSLGLLSGDAAEASHPPFVREGGLASSCGEEKTRDVYLGRDLRGNNLLVFVTKNSY